MKCDVIAEGVIEATKQVGLELPLVVRLEGTNVELGKKILNESGLNIVAENLWQTVHKNCFTSGLIESGEKNERIS